MSKISFNNKNNPFFKSLKEKVDLHFAHTQTKVTGNFHLYFKSGIQFCTLVGLYITLVFFEHDTLLSLILCALLGFNLAVVGFNIMHEGGHQSFSSVKWVNKVSAYFLNALGGNAMYWKVKHNINHHTYTNVQGMDDDIDVAPFMRLHIDQRRYWMHRFQHVYWVVLYGATYFTWIFVDDFVKYFTGNIAPGTVNQKWKTKEHVIFWGTKLSYAFMYVALPMFFVGVWATLIGFAVMVFFCGLSIGIVFQMAHIVEDTAFVNPTEGANKLEKEWAIHQVQTTANFATGNRTLSWLLGGLNFQVEHHLFPRISHVHYPAINKLVKETCKEYNVSYVEYPSMFRAFCSHLAHIKRMGVA